MPTRFVGRITSQKGKPLFEILSNLKNFGVGRLYYRNTFMKRYPEPSFIVLTSVQPDMRKSWDSIEHRVTGHQYFRGEYQGEFKMRSCYKPDWRLVPRHEESELLNFKLEEERPRNIIPDSVALPPLLERMKIEELKAKGETPTEKPRLPITICKRPFNRALQESEAKYLDIGS